MSNSSSITEIGSTTSGWVPINGNGIFFVKIADNEWLTTTVSDIYSKASVEKLKFVSEKAATAKINKNYIQILAAEFGVSTATVTDSVIVGYISNGTVGSESGGGEKPEGDYIVDGSSVVVNGQKYDIGDTVYHGGFKFKVAASGDEVYLTHPSGGVSGDSPITGKTEVVSKVNYKNAVTLVTPTYSSINAKFNNIINSTDVDKVIIPQKGTISRVLKASQSGGLRYWECFKFHSGITASDKVETVVSGPWGGEVVLKS